MALRAWPWSASTPGYFSGNEASGGLQRKLGFEREGLQRRHIVRFGEQHDLEMYALLRRTVGVPAGHIW